MVQTLVNQTALDEVLNHTMDMFKTMVGEAIWQYERLVAEQASNRITSQEAASGMGGVIGKANEASNASCDAPPTPPTNHVCSEMRLVEARKAIFQAGPDTVSEEHLDSIMEAIRPYLRTTEPSPPATEVLFDYVNECAFDHKTMLIVEDLIAKMLPYLRSTEPVSVDLEDAVRALWNADHDHGHGMGNYDAFKARYPNDCKAHAVDYWTTAKDCAEAWGVEMGIDEKAMRVAATEREKYRVANFHMTTQQESDRAFLEAYEAAKASAACEAVAKRLPDAGPLPPTKIPNGQVWIDTSDPGKPVARRWDAKTAEWRAELNVAKAPATENPTCKDNLQVAGQPVECSVCKGNKSINGSFDLSGNFEGEDNCPKCTIGIEQVAQPDKGNAHEQWFCREYKTPHSGFGVKESVVKASQKAWEAQEIRVAECQRQANELIEARNRTIRFLEGEIERLGASEQENQQTVDCREAFENWYDSLFDLAARTSAKNDYGYPGNAHIQQRWQAWQGAWNARPPEREAVTRWQPIVDEIDAYQHRCDELRQMGAVEREHHRSGILEVLHIVVRMTGAKSYWVDKWQGKSKDEQSEKQGRRG